MSRLASSLLLVFALGLGATLRPLTADPADTNTAINKTLALQRAMGNAQQFLLDKAPQKAIEVLEDQLQLVNGNRAYLALLSEAYRAYIKELWLAHQDAQARRYLERLRILEPNAGSDPSLQPPSPPAPVAVAPAPPPPAEEKPAKVFPDFKLHNPFFARQKAEAQTPPVPGRPTAVRAKLDEGEDPFDLRLQRTMTPLPAAAQADLLLGRAEQEFDRKNYAEARQYYEQAYQVNAASVAVCRDRWAFCLLHQVEQQLNQHGLGGRSVNELQQQVQTAVAMAPQMATAARRLQQALDNQSRGSPDRPPQVVAAAPQVQHLGKNREGWQVTETPHFRIFHGQSEAVAERVAQVVEQTRLEKGRKWFGTELAVWQPKCELILHPSGARYTQMTEQSASSPGHSRIEIDPSGRVTKRRMDIRLDLPGALEGVLPHEATHVVLAGEFGPFFVPRWADEGMAVLSEPAEKIEAHRRNLVKFHAEGLLFGLRELMEMDKYPEPRRVGAFYAQSVFLVEFLANEKGPQVLTAFVRDGLRGGYENALRKHYGWDFVQLEQQWQQRVLGGGSRMAGAGPRQ